MKRAVSTGRSVNLAHGKPAGMGALLPRRDGGTLTKKNVVQFYNDLAKAAGFQGRVTGHSARVEGAMRMAYARHTEWTIQLFGRWGSNTVLKYVREALLGREGGTIAQVTEGYLPHSSLEELKAYVNEVVSGYRHEKVSPEELEIFEGAVVAELEESVLPELTKMEVVANSQEVSERIFEKIVDLDQVLYEAKATLGLRYVSCGTARRHLAGPEAHCLCGRKWTEERNVRKSHNQRRDTKGGWCRICLARLAKMKPEVGGEDLCSRWSGKSAASELQAEAD